MSLENQILRMTKSVKDLTPVTKKLVEDREVYDITVQDNHNYFIYVDEDLSILSHNCLEFVVREIIGPISVISKTTSLIPELQIIETNLEPKVSKLWVHSISSMLSNVARNNLIIQHVFQDLKTHPCIIIPTDRVEHVQLLKKLINEEALKRDLVTPGSEFAYTFYGGMLPTQKKEALAKVESGECRVLVSMRSMIKQGIDLRTPTILYSIIPETANKEAGSPMFLQLSNRPCTPHKDKKQPIVKMFIDNTGLATACFRSLYHNEIRPNLVPGKDNNFTIRYKISDETKQIATKILSKKKF